MNFGARGPLKAATELSANRRERTTRRGRFMAVGMVEGLKNGDCNIYETICFCRERYFLYELRYICTNMSSG